MTDKTKPLILMDIHFWKVPRIFSDEDLDRLTRIADIAWGEDTKIPIEAAMEILPHADAVVSAGWRYGANGLAVAGNLRAIVDMNGDWPDVDYAKCRERSIYVLSTAPSFGYQVAEMALGMTLALCREICAGDRAMREATEAYVTRGNRTTFLLRGKKVGFVGFGALARAIMSLLAPFGCSYRAYYPSVPASQIRRAGCEPMELDELLSTSDVIYVVMAPSARSHGLLDRRRLELLAENALLLLLSRASVVDFDALTECLLANRFRAAIDVFPVEPLPRDHPIRRTGQTVLSAHRAGSVEEGLKDLGRDVVDDLEAIFSGHPPFRLYEHRGDRPGGRARSPEETNS